MYMQHRFEHIVVHLSRFIKWNTKTNFPLNKHATAYSHVAHRSALRERRRYRNSMNAIFSEFLLVRIYIYLYTNLYIYI